eukprot:CAMPEP_0177211602 /NCGR_PEP_ID=MMETSP0367-20130122/32181_1 /TAXON_ID=447022 ORGANISM="Scrippsiella hangoei-like, Strain SHHI-4" /NCGR_SAMPLE_ID=MMETSP0367 /ASSEMBLY_ACC=CAM_ASM_000362 /LENGTH=1009 /DNA_ID=CAMNT_0018660801 /DNA_START=1 /DNA_END=3027 /DNA_ORIENTATION=-
MVSRQESADELMGTVFELVVKEGVFSYTTVYGEVSHFFKGLGLHPMYFEHFTAMQIAKHIHCLIAAKRVAQATNDMSRMDFALTTPTSGTFLTTIDCPQPTEAQKRTEGKVAKHLDSIWTNTGTISLAFMASEGPLYKRGSEKLGIFTTLRDSFDPPHISEGETTSLEVLASPRFLKEKTRPAKEQYQIMMEDIVSKGRAVVRIVHGSVYPGPYPGGFVLQFGSSQSGRTYFTEVCQAMRFVSLTPRRFYLETFANDVTVYSIFFPSAKEEEVQALGRAIMYSTILKTSDMIYGCVMEARISHEVGLYLSSAVKFVFAFFPREQYAREYMDVHQVLENDPASQRKLESLYKLCMKDLLSTDRIFDLINRNMDLAVKIFEDFRSIATGKSAPEFNTQLEAAIESCCTDVQDRQIWKMFLTFNQSILLTNFFKAETPGAFAFRLNPTIVLKGRPASLWPASLYPDEPYGIYLVSGRNFLGFHVRFRDVARGGVRLVLSRDYSTYEHNVATLFDECYNLAFTQQMKNKDIPEGGSKGVILPDPSNGTQNSEQSPAMQKSCFAKYLNSLLDCMLPEQQPGIFSGHMAGRKEILFFGPDENTANFMDLGAEIGKVRGYPYWKALTTGKSVKFGGVPHDIYGMTTASVHTYVTELLAKLGEDEACITKFQTGGPDGDLGSNEILVSKDRTIGIVDGSGVLFDPAGLKREELMRLALLRAPVKEFSRSFVGRGGFLVTCEETNVTLPDGSKWSTGAQLRDNFHLTPYASADLFVPCGGRPNSVTTGNVKTLFNADGRPKFRMICEGANLFLSDGARAVLEKAGVHVFKDASTNKGGVCSSSLEVLAALAMPEEEHSKLMTYNPDETQEPPEFYATYVQQILSVITENARNEFRAIWECNQKDGLPKIQCTSRLSIKINQMSDSIQTHFKSGMSEQEKKQLVRSVLLRAVPPILLEKLGLEGILARVPENYVGALVGAWVASKFVYKHGINASEVSFFFFMRSLVAGEEAAALPSVP